MFVVSQINERNPLLQARFFLLRQFTADAVVLFSVQFAVVAQTVFIPVYLQRILNFSPLEAGSATLFFVLPWTLMAPVSGWMFDRFGNKLPASLGLACVSVGFLVEAIVFPKCEFVWIVPAMILSGSGLGLAIPQTYIDAISSVPPDRRGEAFGMIDTIRWEAPWASRSSAHWSRGRNMRASKCSRPASRARGAAGRPAAVAV